MIHNKYWLDYYKRQLKVAVHKLGQGLFSPIWNFLPELDLYTSLVLTVIPTKICNANCIFCCYQFLEKSERIHMSDTVFFRIIESIKKSRIRKVHFTSNSGEPLVHPNILDMMQELRKAGVNEMQLTTNAINLDKVEIDKFFAIGPNVVNISTSPPDASTYRRIYRSEQFERMYKNMINLLTENKLRGYPIHITVQIRSDISKKAVLAMRNMQKVIELADEVNVWEEYGSWLGLITSSMLSGTMRLEKPAPLKNRPCVILMTVPAIHPNGDIVACTCRNINNDPDMYLGNILNMDLDTALNKIKNIAVNWRRGQIPKTCSLCTMYNDPAYYWLDYFRKLLFQLLRDRHK